MESGSFSWHQRGVVGRDLLAAGQLRTDAGLEVPFYEVVYRSKDKSQGFWKSGRVIGSADIRPLADGMTVVGHLDLAGIEEDTRALSPFDPLGQPHEIDLMESVVEFSHLLTAELEMDRFDAPSVTERVSARPSR